MAKIATAPAKNGAGTRVQQNRGVDQNEVAKLAYQFFVERGRQHGHHQEDWLRAETIVRNRKRQ